MLGAGVLDEDQALADLGELCTLLRKGAKRDEPGFIDDWMRVLLHRVSDGDGRDADLAARVLVQAMLPHACRVLRGCVRSGEDIEDTRGDGPRRMASCVACRRCSPHPRGCSLLGSVYT
ncbi:hypothetical protein [Streptomyces sp. C10]|uniref:hypothetical protein n=1 Tax=Streptomyces sp. C10 TaxID=531941 RepID=UPI0039814167